MQQTQGINKLTQQTQTYQKDEISHLKREKIE